MQSVEESKHEINLFGKRYLWKEDDPIFFIKEPVINNKNRGVFKRCQNCQRNDFHKLKPTICQFCATVSCTECCKRKRAIPIKSIIDKKAKV